MTTHPALPPLSIPLAASPHHNNTHHTCLLSHTIHTYLSFLPLFFSQHTLGLSDSLLHHHTYLPHHTRSSLSIYASCVVITIDTVRPTDSADPHECNLADACLHVVCLSLRVFPP